MDYCSLDMAARAAWESTTMTFKGRVRGNIVVIDDPTGLPDGAEVRVELAIVSGDSPAAASFAERFAEFEGCLDGLPEDFAENHDHYVRGVPRRTP